MRMPRIAIERLQPQVGQGRHAVKGTLGQPLAIEADVFADGHAQLAVEAVWRDPEGRTQRHRMAFVGNDRWRTVITPSDIGRHSYLIEAWIDTWHSYVHDLAKKIAAAVPLRVDIEEGKQLLATARRHAKGEDAEALDALVARIAQSSRPEVLALLQSETTRALMDRLSPRRFHVSTPAPVAVDVERLTAAFSSWYELFPRSETHSAERHGTFDDVIARLPAIRAMGFDVLYMPPIHPIGRANRKGPNNSLVAGAADPGSPYAIGGPDGGHDAVHPELGGMAAFRRLRAAAERHGLELALDFAVQCSPDHPWLKQHPEWFPRRPDGSFRHAENPPKQYEDIINPDFYAERGASALWQALLDVVLHWVSEGVRIFRVDNPHTKPLPFWRWLIASVRDQHPEVVFLSEAFTRPAMMYELARIGFSQSYSYFTWRNTKRELMDYMRELAEGEARDFFRPNFFVNTPDINPYFLQNSGRTGFVIRAALASLLSGAWGIYSGFELCEAAALPGREEYLDSEKYQIRPRDWNAPGNIIGEITRLNQIRHSNPALQTHLNLRFYQAGNSQILYFGKSTPDLANFILAAVCLDAAHAQEMHFEVPLWEFGLPDDGELEVEELMRRQSFIWRGKRQHWHFLPWELPVAVWRIGPRNG